MLAPEVQAAKPRHRPAGKGILVLLLLCGVGAAGYYAWERRAAEPLPSPPASPAIPVRSEPAGTATVVDELPAYGNLRPRLEVPITAPQAGQIRQILFTDGAHVAANEPLVLMDDRVALAQVESARARLLADQQNLRRVRDLARQGLESTRSVEQAQSDVAASLSALRVNEARLELTTLRAPFAGALGTRRADQGAMLNAGDKIVIIEDRSRLLVDIRVPSRYLPQLRAGMDVSLDVPNLAENLGRGRLILIDTSVSADTRSILLRAEMDNADDRLTPGLFVRVALQLATRPNAVVVPEQALVRDLVGAFVFLVDKGVATRRAVQLGQPHDGTVEVVQGLKAGERVVTVGAFRLHDGDHVEEVPSAAGGG